MSPAGERFTQKKAVQLSLREQLILLCGHYKGMDERVKESLVDEEISVGDYILTGGEIPSIDNNRFGSSGYYQELSET